MNRFRFSMMTMLACVAIVAAGCAALRHASKIWASAIFTVTLGVLSVALLGILFRVHDKRAFWTGFALFGWIYMLFAFGPWFKDNVGTDLFTVPLQDYLYSGLKTEHSRLELEFEAAGQLSNPAAGVFVDKIHWPAHSEWSAGLSSPIKEISNTDPTVVQATFGTPHPESLIVTTRRKGSADVVVTDQTGQQTVFRFIVGLNRPNLEHFRRIAHSLSALLIAVIGAVMARYFFFAPHRDEPT